MFPRLLLFILSFAVVLPAVGQVELKRVHLGKSLRTSTHLYGERLGGDVMASGRFDSSGAPDYILGAHRNFLSPSVGFNNPLRVFSGDTGEIVDALGFTSPLVGTREDTFVTVKRPSLSTDILAGIYFELGTTNSTYHLLGLRFSPMAVAYDILLPDSVYHMLAVDDVTGDGVQDLLLEDATGELFTDGTFKVFSGATGLFLGGCEYSLPEQTNSIIVSMTKVRDMTGDGLSDTLVLYSDGQLLLVDPMAVRTSSTACLPATGQATLAELDYESVRAIDSLSTSSSRTVLIGRQTGNGSSALEEFTIQRAANILFINGTGKRLDGFGLRVDNGDSSIAFVRDVTGDGLQDILVSYDIGSQGSGIRVELLDYASFSVLRTYRSPLGSDSSFGYGLMNVGDLNGDGIDEFAASASNDISGNPSSDFLSNFQTDFSGIAAGAVYIFSAAPESYFPPPTPPTAQLAKARRLAKALASARDSKVAKRSFKGLVTLISNTLSAQIQSTAAGQKIYSMAQILAPKVNKKLSLKAFKALGKKLVKAAK